MKAELQFFALPNDAEATLIFAKTKVDNIETNAENISHLIVGDCELIYTAGEVQDDLLIVGSLAINTGPVGDTCADQERAKAVYRDLRKWFKKNYSNKLNTYHLEGDRKDAAARNHWISPAAKVWKGEVSDRMMKLYDTSPVAFDVMIVSRQIGDLVPVESNKVRGHG
ncbi:MAG: hypothetical protein V3U78_03930 [Thiotrichaceae bacterium]